MSTCTQRTFKWTEQAFTLQELVAQYRHLLPFPVLVTHGCTPRSEPKLSPSSGQVYWIHDVIKCKYLIVKNKQGTQFKIPESMDALVIPTKSNGTDGKPIPFRQIRSEIGFKYFRFVEPQPDVIGEDMKPVNDKVSLKDLQLFDLADEDMLVVHAIFMENLMAPCKRGSNEQPHHKVVPRCFKLMPAYLPVRVSIAVSLALAPELIYFHTMAEIKQIVDSYEHSYEKAISEAAEILLNQSSNNYVNIAAVMPINRTRKSSLTPAQVSDAPVSLAKDIDPAKRLQRVAAFRKTGDAGSFDVDIDQLENDGFLEPDNWLDTCQPRSRRGSTSIVKQVQRQQPNATWLRMRFKNQKDKQTRKTSISDVKESSPVAPSYRPTAQPSSRQGADRCSVPTLPSEVRLKDKPKLPQRHSFDIGDKPKAHSSLDRRITSVADVPSDISGLSIDQVTDCLELLNLSDYVPLMQRKKVDGRLLMCMSEEDLKSVFGFSDFNATKLIQFAQCGWRPKTEVSHQSSRKSAYTRRFQLNLSAAKKPGRHNSVY